MKDSRRADEGAGHEIWGSGVSAPKGIAACIAAAKKPFAWLARALHGATPADASPYRKALMGLESDALALSSMIRGLVSPGESGFPGEMGA
jgi:hypothetical protein